MYEPLLVQESFCDALAPNGLTNIKADGTIQPVEAGKDASVTFQIDSPYVAVDAWLDATVFRATTADTITVSVKGKKGGWQKASTVEATGTVDLEKISLKDAAWFGHGYQVRLTLNGAKPGSVKVEKLRITTVFMNNMYALPYFMPGKNTIRVGATEDADVKANPLTLEYVWEEDGQDKTLKKSIQALPFACTVDVSGKELPRMKSVSLSVAP